MNYRKYIIGLVILTILAITYFYVDSILFDGIKPRVINEDGFQANYFTVSPTKNKAVILLCGGQWGDYWAQEFAKKGYSGLSLPYSNREGLPKLPEEIDIEYFEKAINWLAKQPQVDSKKIVVMGASRNAELALVIASLLPELVSGVIAYSPSCVSWSNTVLPFNSDSLKASWRFRGENVAYVPMEKMEGNDSGKIETLSYWRKGLAKKEHVGKASIKVGEINGPILLFSGKDDKVWPSAYMASMIEVSLSLFNFGHRVQSIQYENAGHGISGNPEDNSNYRTSIMKIEGKDYEYELGGTKDGDKLAKVNAKVKVMEYLDRL